MAKLDDWLDAEEHFFRREHKAKRYHKTQNLTSGKKKHTAQDGQKLARVLSLSPEIITVMIDEQLVTCSIKGSLKCLKRKEKNLIVVGDWVQVEIKGANSGVITDIEPRHSFLSRRDSFSQRKQHLIAVNVDQVFITLSVVAPFFTPMLIDRYIIATKKGNMEPLIIINKMDLFSDPPKEIPTQDIEAEQKLFDTFYQAFSPLDIPIFQVSCRRPETLAPIKKAMRNKTSVFSGPSGTGKSSLINATTDANLTTGALVEKTNKGRHTTTAATLIPLEGKGFCIDTPGIQSFSLWNLASDEVRSYFPDFSPFDPHCRFPDCTHQHEPDCAVKEALEAGRIHPMRYASYSALLADPSPKEWE
ncbi:MAG: ribosome small subunit-dependent GTPase A [Chlamydiota bacterium]